MWPKDEKSTEPCSEKVFAFFYFVLFFQIVRKSSSNKKQLGALGG